MSAANIIDCLSDLLENYLTFNSTSCISQKKREVALHLCETIITFNGCKNFEFEEEITLDVGEISDEYENDVDKKNKQNIFSHILSYDLSPRHIEKSF